MILQVLHFLHSECDQAWEAAFDERLLQQGQRRRLRISSCSPRNCQARREPPKP